MTEAILEPEDPRLLAFLDFLEEEIENHPERLIPITQQLASRMRAASAGVEVDLDDPIEGPVGL